MCVCSVKANRMEWNGISRKIPKCIFSPKTFENERKSIVFGQQFGMEFGSFQVLEKVSVSTVNSFDFSRYFSLSIALCNCNAMWYRILCVVRSTILLAVFILLILESATGRCRAAVTARKRKEQIKCCISLNDRILKLFLYYYTITAMIISVSNDICAACIILQHITL